MFIEKFLNLIIENLIPIGLSFDILGTIFALKTFVFLTKNDANVFLTKNDANRITVPTFSVNSVTRGESQDEAEGKAEEKFYSFRKDARIALFFLVAGFILQIIGQFI